MLHKNFWELLETFKHNDIGFSILGNPFHIDDNSCEKLKALGCEKYQLSIDGLRRTHDYFRKPGSFDTTLNAINTINKAGICSVIMSTVSGLNIDEIPDVIDLVVEHEAEVFSFARYCPTSSCASSGITSELSSFTRYRPTSSSESNSIARYCPTNSGEGNGITPEELSFKRYRQTNSSESSGITPEKYREFLSVCDEKFRTYEAQGCRTYFDRKDHLWTLYDYEAGRFSIPNDAEKGIIYGGCNCGNAHITILPSGDVYACRRVRNSKVGNVLTDKLSDLWLNEMENFREYDKFVKCSKCELLPYCRGCPAVAMGTYGNFYAEDPQCWKEVK